MNRSDLVLYLDNYLKIGEIGDYGPQGLQVETDNAEIGKIALAVDVSPAIIEAAAAWDADMLLVHHGILWRNVEPIAGPLGARVRAFMGHQINLYAAHLPLDAHPVVGNNAGLAEMLGLTDWAWWAAPKGTPLGVCGNILPVDVQDLVDLVNRELETSCRLLAHGPQEVKRVAILSGFGADKVAEAKEMGADTYLTGETSHAQYWAAADYGMNLIYAGHYATETVGVKRLGAHLVEQFGLETKFFDFATGM